MAEGTRGRSQRARHSTRDVARRAVAETLREAAEIQSQGEARVRAAALDEDLRRMGAQHVELVNDGHRGKVMRIVMCPGYDAVAAADAISERYNRWFMEEKACREKLKASLATSTSSDSELPE